MKLTKTEDCLHCGNCPICGKPNNHYHHTHKPWTLYPCHPFYDGVALSEAEEEGLRKLENNEN